MSLRKNVHHFGTFLLMVLFAHTHTRLNGEIYIYIYIYISGAEAGLVLLVPGMTNNSVNVIQNGLKIIHSFQANILSLISIKLPIYSSFHN